MSTTISAEVPVTVLTDLEADPKRTISAETPVVVTIDGEVA